MRDLICGRITGRFDFYSQLRAAFPESLAKYLLKIVRRTRLDLSERDRVTQELIGRFQHRIHERRSWQTVQSRLDKRRIARSIRRRYKHQRQWLRRAFDKSLVAVAFSPLVLIFLYLCAVVFFWSQRPTVSVDYLAQLNAPALAVPEKDRAWPLYREAYLGMNEYNEVHPKPEFDGVTPYQPRWNETGAFLKAHQYEMDLIRKAAIRPGLGLTAGLHGHYEGENAIVFYGRSESDPNLPAERNVVSWQDPLKPMAFWMELADFWPISHLAQDVASDAYLAIEEHDPDRMCEDLESMFGMAKHIAEVHMHQNGLSGIAIREMAYGVISDVLTTNPTVLRDSHLERLVDLVDKDAEHQLIFVEGDRLMLLDYVQRIYTDNGQGNGHITPEGICLLREDWDWEPMYVYTWANRLGHACKAPIEALYIAPRQEVRFKIEELYHAIESELYVPMWQLPESTAKKEIWNWSSANWRRYGPLHLTYDYTRARESITLYAAKHEGIRTGIALERYRRDHGGWPASLDGLLGQYLEELPRDPMTGGQARYMVINDQPVVYSVGVDGDDDQAHLPFNMHWRDLDNEYAEGWGKAYLPADGDWIIYPDPETYRVTEREADLPDVPEPIRSDEYGMMGYGYDGFSWYDWPDVSEAEEGDNATSP